MWNSTREATLPPASTDVVDPIEDFYTRHPYPPPVDNLDRARDEWRDLNRLRAEYHRLWPERPYRADLDILIAGCGTWQAAKYALCQSASNVVGIDVSQTSIDHTQALKRKYDLVNLELARLPVEHAGDLNRQFDVVVCTGVLHHLVDPDVGLRALRSVLKPHGVIYLMVYAPYGRTGVYMLQDYARRLGIGTSDREIQDLLATLESLPQHHPLVPVLRGSRDVMNADALADALLNPRDRSYTVSELLDLLERNGLTLRRWYGQAPYLPQCGAVSTTPHARRLAELSDREQYAAMELWRGAMTTHSAVVQRQDAPETTVSLDDDRWLHWVPVRLPWTQLILEGLPPGAAGVLLNRSHPFRDLILVLDASQKRLFDRIDGRRTIGEIAGQAHSADRSLVRTLFRKLWWYDQVVFDMSGTGRA